MKELAIASIAVVAAWGGSLIAGLFGFLMNRNIKDLTKHKKYLLIAYEDILSFRELEKLYTEEVAQLSNSNANSVKSSFRKKIRTPLSCYSEPARIEKYLKEMAIEE